MSAALAHDPIMALTADEWMASAARDSLLSFTRRMFPEYRAADHHRRIADRLEAVERGDVDRLVVTMPPRHGKSTLVSEHFPAWYLGRNPDKRVIGCAHTANLAYRFSRQARSKLRHPAWPFPDVRPASDLSAVQSWDIANHRGGYIAAGVGGPITGFGANTLLVDDPVKSAEEADSETFRERAWEWWTGTAATRFEPGGAAVVVGTRWHESDLIGRLLQSGRWEVLHLPALSEDGTALWSERYDETALAKIKAEVGERNFAAQYQGKPSPPSGGIFKRHWWRFWHVSGVPLPPVPVRGEDGGVVLCPCEPLPVFWDDHAQSWDMAFKGGEDNSFVVGQVWSRVRGSAYLRTQVREHLDFPQSLAAVRALSAAWPFVATKLVEDKANGPAVIATLAREIPGIVPVGVTGSKEARANAAAPAAEAGNLYLPHPAIAPWVNGLIEEAAGFPHGTTDQVDALSQAVNRLLFAGSRGVVQGSYLPNGQTEDDDERGAVRW